MVPVTSLWLPILVAAIVVFMASSVIHMLTPWHAGDFRGVPDEDEVLSTLRRLNLSPGEYVIPYAASAEARKQPAFRARLEAGPAAFLTIWKGSMSMGGPLAGWFAYSLVIGLFAGYVAGAALPVGAPYLDVFRLAGTTAFAGYSLALPQQAIWYKRSWGATLRTMVDGLVYGCLTAGVFGWLWPR